MEVGIEQMQLIDINFQDSYFPIFVDAKMKKYLNYKNWALKKILSLAQLEEFVLYNYGQQKLQNFANNNLIRLFQDDKPVYLTEKKEDYIAQHQIL